MLGDLGRVIRSLGGRMTLTRRATLGTLAAGLALPWVRPSYAAAGSVNIYSWAEYIGETTLADFEAETGIYFLQIQEEENTTTLIRHIHNSMK